MDKSEQDQLKKEAATKAAMMVEPGSVLGVGTGSTVAFFIDALGERKEKRILVLNILLLLLTAVKSNLKA